MKLANCWDVKKCGREAGGGKADELGVCPAYPDHGHSCWIVAGTFCGGEIHGTFAADEVTCTVCDVYKLYSPSFGASRVEFKERYPAEFARCRACLTAAAQG